jgi:hypothetical protein
MRHGMRVRGIFAQRGIYLGTAALNKDFSSSNFQAELAEHNRCSCARFQS